MEFRIFLITVIVFLFIFDTDGRRTIGGSSRSRSGSSGSGGGYSGRSRYQSTQQKSTDHSWSTGSRSTNTNNNAKPSAPVNEHASKTSATNVQSGHNNPSSYNPSGGYPRQPASNPYGPPSSNQPAYNPGYNPSYPGGGGYGAPPPYGHHNAPPAYSPPYGHHNAPPAYSPPYGHHNAPPAYSPYGGAGGFGGQQSFAQPSSYVQPAIQQAPALTVLQPSRPGIGQLAKEALVYSSVSAGVSAAVNRLLPGGIYGRSPGSGSGSHTEITYNNYYYNQTQTPPSGDAYVVPVNNNGAPAASPNAPAAPALSPPAAEKKDEASAPSNAAPPTDNANSQSPQQNNPSQPNYPISSDEIKKLSESLFEADKNNAYKYITVNLQGQTKEDGTGDDAPLPLLDVKSEAYEIPTIKSVLALHDNYEMDVKMKETVTPEERKEEAELLVKFLETDVFKATMKFLVDKGFVPNDQYDFEDTLKRIWFSQFQRVEGEPSSSGFEAVFVAEKLDSYMIGPQNWIYFAKQEAQKHLDYRGYIKDVKLGDKGEAIKIRSAFNIPDTKHAITTLLVGLSPELEMALYTLCFYVRPNDVCPVSLGGKDVNLVSTRFNYFGKDILIAGFIAG